MTERDKIKAALLKKYGGRTIAHDPSLITVDELRGNGFMAKCPVKIKAGPKILGERNHPTIRVTHGFDIDESLLCSWNGTLGGKESIESWEDLMFILIERIDDFLKDNDISASGEDKKYFLNSLMDTYRERWIKIVEIEG